MTNNFSEHFKKKLLIAASAGLLLSCLSVAVISIWPLYNQLKTLQTNRLVFEVQTRAMMVEQFLQEARETARQITSRSAIREFLEKYNNKEIDIATLRKFTTPKLLDAIHLSNFAVGISRLDKRGKPVVQVGVAVPKKILRHLSNFAVGISELDKSGEPVVQAGLTVPKKFLHLRHTQYNKPVLSGPVTIGNQLYIVVSAPIINRQKKQVGMDIVLFTTSKLREIVRNYNGLGATGEMILGRLNVKKQPRLFFTLRLAGKADLKAEQSEDLTIARQALKQADTAMQKGVVHLLDNSHELAAYSSIKGIDWNIAVIMDKTELFKDISQDVLIIVLVIVVLVIPLGWMGLIFLLRPLSGRMLIHVDTLQQEITAKEEAIKELDQAEKKLLAEKEQLNVTLHSIGDAVITTDLDGCIVLMNKIAEQLTGWNYQQATGQPLHTVFNIISGETRVPCDNPVDKVLISKKVVGLANHTVLVSKKGTEYQIADSGAPIMNQKGEILGVVLVFRDVTRQYQTEETLRRSHKMEAIGQLSGGIAHDFNNQLGIVIGYLDFLEGYAADDEKPRKWVENAARAAQRCVDLTRQLLVFSRRKSGETSVVDINAILRELEVMIARSVTPEVEVEYFLVDDLWPTQINSGEFQDVILNLVINARDAMPEGGKLLIETSNKYLDADYTELNPELKTGDYIQLMISDTGTGMDKKTLDHVFEPFFTTKPEGKGTGLGMAMVYGFLKRYGGDIRIYSELGLGSTMRLYLPRSTTDEVITVINNNHQGALPTGSETILLVDDEIDLLQLAEQYLMDLGYRTCTAERASQALKILAEDKEIDLLFSDVVMPGGINGYELAERATQQHAGLKVLLTSGFTSKTMTHNGLERFAVHLLNKPYRKADLAQRIRQVLDDTAGGSEGYSNKV